MVTMGSCVASGDHTQASGGFTLPPFLVARRFQTMNPVYLGFFRIS